MKQKKKLGCGTIVWVVIGLLIVSSLIRTIIGRNEESPVVPDKAEESIVSPNEISPEMAIPDSETEMSTPSHTESSLGITPEFKDTMDSYEAFFDEYIAFMEAYSKSDDTSSMMMDYLSYMSKYTEVMQKLEEIDEETLSDADALYYTQVQLRISEKLLAYSNQ